MEAALLELLAAAAWAGIVPPDTLERVNKRLGCVGKGQTNILRTGGPPLLILLGCIRESVPARELADRILQRPDLVVLEARHALGIGQSSLQIPAKVIVAHHHRFDQTTPERLADNTGQRIAAWLTHIPTEVADGVSFRAHEGDTGRRHAKGQASRQARSRERSVSRADHRKQAAGPVS